MADANGRENESLGIFSKKQARYGSTSPVIQTNETYRKHYLKIGETLQGIALKYGITMEQIKRANNIWTNESLFSRDFILIPMLKSPSLERTKLSNSDSGISTASEGNPVEYVTSQELRANRLSKSSSRDFTKSLDSDVPEFTANDFLSRFDNTLAQIKANVNNLEKTTNFPEDGSNPLNHLPKRKSRYGARSSISSVDTCTDSDDPSAEPNLVIKSKNNSRQVRDSMERLERHQEDTLFKL